MIAKKGFSKKDLADQNAKVAELAKEESKLISAIERGERTLAENRDKLKETQRAKATENALLEQMIQRGIKAAARGDTGKRAALIAALLMSDDGEEDGGDEKKQDEHKSAEPKSVGQNQEEKKTSSEPEVPGEKASVNSQEPLPETLFEAPNAAAPEQALQN